MLLRRFNGFCLHSTIIIRLHTAHFTQGGAVFFESSAVAENRPVGQSTHFTLASCPRPRFPQGGAPRIPRSFSLLEIVNLLPTQVIVNDER